MPLRASIGWLRASENLNKYQLPAMIHDLFQLVKWTNQHFRPNLGILYKTRSRNHLNRSFNTRNIGDPILFLW